MISARWRFRTTRAEAGRATAAGDTAQVRGRLRVPQPEDPLDKQIAATALMYDLIVVTRNVAGFASTGSRLMNRVE